MLKLIRWKMKNWYLVFLSKRKKTGLQGWAVWNWTFQGCLPLCQNESLCQTIGLKMCVICSVIFMEIKFIFMRKILHEESL